MIGIEAIASYVPVTTRDNLMQAKRFGESDDFIRNRIGALTLPILADGEDTSDLASRAVLRLLEDTGTSPESIECLILCTQNPDNRGLPHTSAIVQHKAGLPKHTAAFDISLGCSGYVYGLCAIKGFMESAGLKKGILVTADPYSKIIDPADKNTTLLYGDAATATLISDNPAFTLGKVFFGTDGAGAVHLVNNDGKLFMNGRQIFNFAATTVPAQIKQLLDDQGITEQDVDLFILHQGSRYIIDTLSRKMGLPADRVPDRIEHTGNTVSSSIPLILAEYINDENSRLVLICGFGVGLSWGTMLLERKKKEL